MLFCPRCEDVYELGAAEGVLFRSTMKATRRLDGGAAGRVSSPLMDGSSGASTAGCVGPPAPAPASGWRSTFLGLDGAFFGPTFPHVLLMQSPELLRPKPTEEYVPRVYGFRVHNQRGPLRRSAGDSRGVYATSIPAPPSVATVALLSSSAAADAAISVSTSVTPVASPPPPKSSGSLRATRSRTPAIEHASVVPAVGGQLTAVEPSVPSRQSQSIVAASSSLPVAAAAQKGFQPVSSSSLPVRPSSGSPASLAPFVWPVPGIPGGIPVYGDAVFCSTSATSAGPLRSGACGSADYADQDSGRVVEHGGASYLVMRPSGIPLVSVYPPGEKPIGDDFSDGEIEPPVELASRKRRRKT